MTADENRGGSNPQRSWLYALWYLIPLLPVTVYLLLAEHRAHVSAQVPYALAGLVLSAVVVRLVTRRHGDRGNP